MLQALAPQGGQPMNCATSFLVTNLLDSGRGARKARREVYRKMAMAAINEAVCALVRKHVKSRWMLRRYWRRLHKNQASVVFLSP